jgi:hypothetical protein
MCYVPSTFVLRLQRIVIFKFESGGNPDVVQEIGVDLGFSKGELSY